MFAARAHNTTRVFLTSYLCLIFALYSLIAAHVGLIYLTWLSFSGERPAVNTTWSTRLALGSLLSLGCLESTSLSRRWSLCIRRYKLQFAHVYSVTWFTFGYKTYCYGRKPTHDNWMSLQIFLAEALLSGIKNRLSVMKLDEILFGAVSKYKLIKLFNGN